MVNSLNPRQLAFIEAYTTPNTPAYRNGTKAAAAAGYAPSSAHVQASRLLSLPNVSGAIRAREAELAEVAGYTRARYVDEAAKMRDAWLDKDGKQRTETVFNRDGQPTGERMVRPDSANVRAHELIGKAVGYLGDKAGESKPVLIVTNVQALAAAVTKQEPEDQEPEARWTRLSPESHP